MSAWRCIVSRKSDLFFLASAAVIVAACVAPPSAPESSLEELKQAAETRAHSAASHISAHLQAGVDALDPGEFLPVIIRFEKKAGVAASAGFIDASGKDENRRAAIADLQQATALLQRDAMISLAELQSAGLVRNVQPLWLANVICLDARAESIHYLLGIADVERISADTEAPLFLQQIGWGVERVNSPQVWRRAAGAYTGLGVVVAVLDSGADLDHPDLVRRFWINGPEDLDGDGRLTRSDNNGVDDDGNGVIDDVIGWDFESDDNDPSPNLFESGRGRGHGTHVAGIIAGDGTNGTATGVAPGAQLMILKINSQRSVWAAMQYALENGADILNMSMGWTESLFPDYGTWRDVIDNLTDAGVLVVTGAGNGGQAPMVHAPAPGDITIPGRVPRALTVAAVEAPSTLTWLDPVAPFSSVGPVTWQAVTSFHDYPFPPGLIKPDVTTPGVNITSTMIGGSYQAKSGTSMAVAHASGAAALLLEQDPTRLPHELHFLLRETAWRFVEPNNVRGWGRIDVEKAIEYRHSASGHDLAIEKPNRLWLADSIWIDNDIDGIADEPIAGMNNRIYARIRNLGGQPVGNVEIRFYYADAGTIGIGGVDPDTGLPPGDGIYSYIGSYFVPVVGPAGSTQDTAVGAVDWRAPISQSGTQHWSLGVAVIAPNPPNLKEFNTANNVAFHNFFSIDVAPGQLSTFRFYVHGDPRQILEPFDLDMVRDGLPLDFDVELSLDEVTTDKWVERMRGFEPVTPLQLAEFPADVADSVSKSIRLLDERGQLERVALTDGEPIMARLVIRAPDIDGNISSASGSFTQHLIINTANDRGIFGGLTLNVSVNPEAAQVKNFIYTQE